MKTTRIYISAFEVDVASVAGDPRYQAVSRADAKLFTGPLPLGANVGAVPRVALATARTLRARGVDQVWFRDFWDYPKIEETIAGCTAMLAVVDEYYFSSTGKTIEICFAAGQFVHTRRAIAPIPIFLLPLDEAYARYRHLEKPGEWTILPPDTQNDLNQLLATLSNAAAG